MLSWIDRWNRKLHTYAGLYLLLFVWLFAVSGLLLNHSAWPAAQFWRERRQERFQRRVELAAAGAPLERARDVMRQLGIDGEIEWLAPRPGRFEFRVTRPGRVANIDVDLTNGVAIVERTTVNAWGVLNMLHSFTGVRGGRPEALRDWWLTMVWSGAVDAVSAGVIFLALSGIWIWFRSGQRRAAGLAALAAGVVACAAFLFGA